MKDTLSRMIAQTLPRRVIYYCMMRVVMQLPTKKGKMPELTMADAMNRWADTFINKVKL